VARIKKPLVSFSQVTNDALARAIGEQLLLHRTRQKLTARAVHRRGGPTPPTLLKIDRGELGTWTQIVQYADAIGVPLDEILRRALEETPAPPVNADEAALMQALRAVSPDLRAALLLAAKALGGKP
jgi:hypothetical protein